MADLKVTGGMKVKSFKKRFLEEFGLSIRIYDGRSTADENATLASIRKSDSKGGEFSIKTNMKVENFENKLLQEFGIKSQIAGKNDTYLCENKLTLAAAKKADEKDNEKQKKKKETNEAIIQDESDFTIDAGWEVREDRNICRWIVVVKYQDNQLAGCLGGYSGGGSFQMEQFVASYTGDQLTSLKIDLEDKITEEEIDFFEDVDDDLLSVCDDAQDVVFEWNGQEEWEEADQLCLLDDKIEHCSKEDDMLFHKNGEIPLIKKLLEMSGITASPIG